MTDIAARLDRLPFSRFHLRLLLIGGMGFLFEALDVAIIAFVLPAIRQAWQLGNGAIGLLASASAIGGMAGAFAGGRLGDRYGRKTVMLAALGLYTVASLACAWSSNWIAFFAWRVLAGAGTAAEAVIIAPYLIEFVPRRFRGRFMGTLGAFLPLGYLAAALIGFSLVPAAANGWRYAMTVAALPILALLWWRRALPESPRWLEVWGRRDEAAAIVTAIEREIAHRQVLPPVVADMPPDAAPAEPIDAAALFGAGLRRRTFVTISICFATGFGYYAFFNWIPSLLVGRGLSVAASFRFSLAIYAAQLPGFLVAAWLNDAIGRRRTIGAFMLASALASTALAVAGGNTALLVGCLGLSFFMNGVYAGIYAFVPELFPTRLRATAQGVAGIATRSAATISPLLIGATLSYVGFLGVFGVIALLLAGGAITVLASDPRRP